MKVVVLHQGDASRAAKSATVRHAVDAERDLVRALRHCGTECVSVLLDDGMDFVHAIQREKPDIVLNACDLGLGYDPKFEPHVTAILDAMHLRYTGSNYLTLALTNDKNLCKQLLVSSGINCPEAVPVRPGQQARAVDFSPPVICKPLANHNSEGIDFSSVLYDSSEVEKRVGEIIRGSTEFLIERYIDGREIIAGFLGNGEEMLVLPLEEIAFGEYFRDKPRILTYGSKWAETDPANLQSRAIIPASLSPELRDQFSGALVKIAAIFGIRDYGRVDFRLDRAGHIYAIDVNANPDVGFDAGLSKMALAHGMDYAEMIRTIVASAQRRTRS